MNKKFYTRQEAADILGVHPQSVSNYAAKGLLHEFQKGPYKMYPREEVDALNVLPAFHDVKHIEEATEAMQQEISEMHAKVSVRYEEMKQEFKRVFTDGHEDNWFRYREIIMQVLKLACDDTLTYRDEELVHDVLNFPSLQDVADRYGLSRERVRQVFERSLRRIMKFRDIATSRLDRANETIEMLKRQNDELKATIWALEHPELGKPATDVVDELTKFRHTVPFNIPLKDLGLSVRAFNCCKAAEIETVGDLCAHTRLDMIKMRNFGRKSLNELDILLEKMKLGFGMWTDPDYDYVHRCKKSKDA
ncbi:MAG: hypothetical protein II841_08725 [Bacteroidales bacterium]|nr:hypothetical protein [Bacteroidales bacterium]